MRRREFIALLGSASVAGSHALVAQQPTIKRVGFLSPQSASSAASLLQALREGLRALGWAEGQNIAFEPRYADGVPDRLPQVASDLLEKKVDVIVADSNPGVLAAKRATGTIPIVMVTTGDPIAGDLVESLARPGANVTGVTTITQELSGKRLELLTEAVPGITRVAALVNSGSPYTARFSTDAQAAAQSLGLDLLAVMR